MNTNQKIMYKVWDTEYLRSMELPSSQKDMHTITLKKMLALRWIKENLTDFYEDRKVTRENMKNVKYTKNLNLFETFCALWEIPLNVIFRWSHMSNNVKT